MQAVYYDLKLFLEGQIKEAVPSAQKDMKVGGKWWGTSPCPYGVEETPEGDLVCNQAPPEMRTNPSIHRSINGVFDTGRSDQ